MFALTRSINPAWTATIDRIISGVLEKDTFIKEPPVTPKCSAKCSVVSPMSFASGIIANTEKINKMALSIEKKYLKTIEIGTKTRKL